MSGDLHNACEKLKGELRAVKYPYAVSERDCIEENPVIFLQILHYVLVDYSPLISEYLIQKDFELYSKNDMRFMECVFKFVIKDLAMKPGININQFFSQAYTESKMNFCCSLIARIRTLRDELDPQKKKAKPKNLNESRYPSKLPGSKTTEEKENCDLNAYMPKEKVNTNQNKKPGVIQEIFQQGIDDYEEIEQSPTFNIKPYPEETMRKENVVSYTPAERDETPEVKAPKKASKNQESSGQMKEVLRMFVELNTVIGTISKKFEEFQCHVENRMNNIDARMVLLENNYKIMRSIQNSTMKATPTEDCE